MDGVDVKFLKVGKLLLAIFIVSNPYWISIVALILNGKKAIRLTEAKNYPA